MVDPAGTRPVVSRIHRRSAPRWIAACLAVPALALAAVSCGSGGNDAPIPEPGCGEDCNTPPDGGNDAPDATPDAGPDADQPDGDGAAPVAACRAIEDNGDNCLSMKGIAYDSLVSDLLHQYAAKVLAWEGVQPSMYSAKVVQSDLNSRWGGTADYVEIKVDVAAILGALLPDPDSTLGSTQVGAGQSCKVDSCADAPATCENGSAGASFTLAGGLIQQPVYAALGPDANDPGTTMRLKALFDGDALAPSDAARASLVSSCGNAFSTASGPADANAVAKAEVLGGDASGGCFFADVKGTHQAGGKSYWSYELATTVDYSAAEGSPSRLTLCLDDGIACGFDATPLGLLVPAIRFQPPTCLASGLGDFELSCGWTDSLHGAGAPWFEGGNASFCSADDPRVMGAIASILQKRFAAVDDCNRTRLDTLSTMIEAAIGNILLTQLDAKKIHPPIQSAPSIQLSHLNWVDAAWRDETLAMVVEVQRL
jgi:hypothetical protein